MKHNTEKPDARAAWKVTCSATAFLMVFGFIVSSDASLNQKVVVAVAEAILIMITVGYWKRYFEAFTRHEIGSLSRKSGKVATQNETTPSTTPKR